MDIRAPDFDDECSTQKVRTLSTRLTSGYSTYSSPVTEPGLSRGPAAVLSHIDRPAITCFGVGKKWEGFEKRPQLELVWGSLRLEAE